jgi:hypothetical protein
MEAGVIAAVISVSGAVALGIANSFVAERYRRFHDGSALAAALAGELASYEAAWPLIRPMFANFGSLAEAGKKDEISLRPFERPLDRIFEESIGKLGLLGTELVEDIVYVYGNIRAFRVNFELISSHHRSMSSDEVVRQCAAALDAIDRAVLRGEPLVKTLRERSRAPFLGRRCATQL